MTDEQTDAGKALAALEESRRELESLSYTIAHDLRAPLRTIDGFTRALSEDCGDDLNEDGRRYLKHVLDATQRMSGMLEGLLSLARIHRAEFHPVQVDLSKIARDVGERLRAADPSREVELAIADGISAEGDASLLTLALEALLQNAWKFTRGRDPARIEFGAHPVTPAVYFVRDNGVGFDSRYAGKLFNPFQRLHPEREFEGTGVGLTMVSRIVRRHGGRVWAEATPDRGATLHFTLSASQAL